MDIIRTVNADRRYYLDEDKIYNADSLVDTIRRFNDIKIQMYNHLYDLRYDNTGVFSDMTYSQWCTDTFGINAYYACAIYSAASGALSSQNELNKIYIRSKEEDLKARDTKIGSVKEQLERKQAVKKSLDLYRTTKKWKMPYTGCQLAIDNGTVHLSGKKTMDTGSFERMVEQNIRDLKHRLKMLISSRERAGKKLEDLKRFPPKRILFGTKKLYSRKDAVDKEGNPAVDREEWKQELNDKRHASISLPGRHTSRDCNFLVRRASVKDLKEKKYLKGDKDALIIRCMDGTEAVLYGFHPAQLEEEWLEALFTAPVSRKPVCYSIQLKRDPDGRLYLIPSVTLLLENHHCNESLEDGCVSIDLNYDHVALTDIDKDGRYISGEILKFDPENKTSGQISDEIGRVMSKVGKFCADRKKPLIMEDIDTVISRGGMRYGNAKGNRHASVFAYRKMTSCLENQAYERSFGLIKIDPAYISQMGKFLFMRKMGISIHAAASYAIGLKGMGLLELLLPDKEMTERLSPSIRERMLQGKDMPGLMAAWREITKKFSGVYTHSFYRKIPYAHKEERTKTGKLKKPKSLGAIAREMKGWTVRYC